MLGNCPVHGFGHVSCNVRQFSEFLNIGINKSIGHLLLARKLQNCPNTFPRRDLIQMWSSLEGFGRLCQNLSSLGVVDMVCLQVDILLVFLCLEGTQLGFQEQLCLGDIQG